jgi:hypothetical protein
MQARHWLAAALLAIATPAAAESVVVDGTRFRYSVPDGYCSLDPDHPGQAQIFQQTAAKVAEQNLKLVVGFNTCTELAAIGAKAPRNVAPDGMVSVVAKSGRQVARLSLSRSEFLDRIRERHDHVSWPRAEAEITELKAGAAKVVRLGIVAEDEHAIYVATALRSTGGVYANLVAFTLAEGRAFQISLTRPLDDRDSFELLLEQQRAMVASLKP